jgi:putative FmdB family regulatory protein
MRYEYECDKCGTRIEKSSPMGKAKKTVKCSCGGKAKRVFSAVAIGIDGRIDRVSGFGEEMKQRNQAAARRQKGNRAPVRTIAHDYGGGDIREA